MKVRSDYDLAALVLSLLRMISRMSFYRVEDCSLPEFAALCEAPVVLHDYDLAARVEDRVLVYEGEALAAAAEQDAEAVHTELARALLDGPGAIMVESAVAVEAIDRASAVYHDLIAEQRAAGGPAGDHFAESGVNDRVWNSLEKLALAAPEVFVDYFSAPAIDIVFTAYLGPGYGMSAQVNVVNPGGAAQSPHRDYHLGFLDEGDAERYPDHIHRLSPLLTLQGGIAHDDAPLETGPTMLLPGSQRYDMGYIAWQRPDFIEYFSQHHTQLPLSKGDMVFFSPALFHGAGENRTTDAHRMVNLLQVSSAFGRNLEAIDRRSIVEAIYPTLLERAAAGDADVVRRAVASAGHGYPFPTNLDRDQPVDRLNPASQAELVVSAALTGRTLDHLRAELDQYDWRRLSR